MKKIRNSFSKKVAVMIFLLSLLLTGAAVFGGYYIFSNTTDKYYQQITLHVADTAAVLTDAKQVQIFEEDGKIPESLRDMLRKVKETNDVMGIYIGYIDPQTGDYSYMVDETLKDVTVPEHVREIMREQNKAALSDSLDGRITYIMKTERMGWVCCAGAPVLDEEGNETAFIMVNRSMNKVMEERHVYLLKLAVVVVFFAAVLTAFVILWMKRTVVEPVTRLTDCASGYVRRKLADEMGEESSVFGGLNIRTGDEIEKLWDAFCQMEQDMNQYIENITQVTAEKERIGAELDIASQIQASMLPGIFPPFPERKEFDLFASMHPAKEVGGDFYDFFLVDENHLALVIADVSGKGVGAALFMVIAKTLIKNQVLMGDSPKQALESVNRQLCENNEVEMFVTVWLGIYDLEKKKVTAVNAGHEYPLIRRKGGCFELFKERHGFVVAGMENTRYTQYEFELNEGDTLFVYTDGVMEATDLRNELFGADRMLEALNRDPDAGPKELVGNLTRGIESFVGDAMQFDDITMLTLQIREGGI